MEPVTSRHIPVEVTSEVYPHPVWRDLGLTDWEYQRLVAALGREPNWTELGMFSALWSEHCAYKHSRPLFALFPTEGERILQGPGENAGVVDIGDGWAVTFKVESHNHPSAVDPYQGAATGVGGILRDIVAMGARPVALLSSLRFGDPRDADTRRLVRGVIQGAADYGAGTGVPAVAGEIGFDRAFQKNPLVNVMAVGLVRHQQVTRACAEGVGSAVIVAGAPTGRDGIHGASFASSELAAEPESGESPVPIGDPGKGKRLIEACLEAISLGLVAAIQDMGAAGLTSSAAEMAARAGSGIEMDLLKVPRREPGMTPFELMLSESQERMLIVARPGAEERVKEIFRKWDLEAAVVGRVTGDGMLRLFEGETLVAQVPARALSTDGAPVYHPEARVPEYLEALRRAALPPDLEGDATPWLIRLLQDPSIASKAPLYRRFDEKAGGRTAVGPGKADAGVLRVEGTAKALAVTVDCNSLHCYVDPRTGAAAAVAEAARNLACTGARPLALSDGLNFGSPEKPEIFWQLRQAVTGIAEAARALGTPVIGGNVSLYNESDGQAVWPTPVIGMVGLIDDAEKVVTSGFKRPGDVVFVLGAPGAGPRALGGSRYLASLHGVVKGPLPELDLDLERRVQEACLEAAAAGILASAHDASDGGLAVALAEAALGGRLGVSALLEAEAPAEGEARLDALLFGEAYSRIVVSTRPEDAGALEAIAGKHGVPLARVGVVTPEQDGFELRAEVRAAGAVRSAVIRASLADLRAAWEEALSFLAGEGEGASPGRGAGGGAGE
ncbi:MAG: phosphoribosylformylglycinamidine synthase subunit PurL [Firmicutes bacterium]|nr:phosphoribosylformylglycinamidine synthase subunit PurL [Bacillota bacterium]